MTRLLLFITVSLVALPGARAASDVLVASNSVWKYMDNGTNLGTAWRSPGFNDSTWRSGPAELGYEDGDEATVVSFGTNAANKYITTYFRRSFHVPDTNPYTSLLLGLLRDDGGVVYLNGQEVFRSNMPETEITNGTFASSTIGPPEESYFYYKTVSVTNLLQGTNVLAVEIHQNTNNSSDLSFNLTLQAFTTPLLVRGPYLQMGSPSNAIVRWRTDVPTDSRVYYGTNFSNSLPRTFVRTNKTTEHMVQLTNLNPSTKYFYAVGSSNAQWPGTSNQFFVTSPPVGTRKPTRLWILGDSGTANVHAANVRDSYLRLANRGRADLCLMLGDNAYTTGTDEQYQAAVFEMYPMVLQNMFLWPAVGNHDTAFSREAVHYPYLDIFNLPTRGEAGGLPSGTEKYYSFDYANIHFICLDSMTSDVTTHGAMLTWLQNDLAATTQDWIIAYFHHPPYTKGSHDSDRDWESIQIRSNVIPMLEAAGVDLVLCGHSHSYERSYLLDGHYGLSSTFANSMKLDAGNGRTNGTGAYRKSQGIAANQGTVYAVAGSSGQTDYGPLNHPAMYVGLEVLGSMILDISSNRLDASFIDTNSVALDQFTIIKDGPGQAPPSGPPFGVSIAQSGPGRVMLRWTDGSSTETGFRIERSTNATQWIQVGATGANTTNAMDSGLAAETTYYYRVRAFNGAGSTAWSGVATVRVMPLPSLTGPKMLADGGFRLLVQGHPGKRYTIERSTNMLTWSAVTTVTNGPDSTPIFYADSGTNSAPRRYYRARVLP